jgi:phosphate transport system substrate-binding protein
METKKKRSKNLELFIFIVLLTQEIQAAPPLRIAGSSAVFPFAATVGEHFSHKTHEPIPLIEGIGTGAGIKLFCGSLKGPDGTITSRPLTETEKEKCRSQGITFENFKIGQDGLILIQKKQGVPFSLTLKDLNRALAEKIPQGEVCIKNPHKTWSEIQNKFPAYPIRVYGPAPTSGSYDVLVEKIMGSCGLLLRHDGAYIEAPANENLIVQKVLNAPQTIGIVTFSFYEQNRTRLHALPIDGILPSITSIQKGDYPLSRPLYLYVKTNNIKDSPSRAAYVLEFTSKDAVGEEGYLNEKGLIPLSSKEQAIMHKRALNLQQGNTP